LPFKKLEDEKIQHEKLLIKKRQKFAQRRLGFLPCSDWSKKEEKNLSKITTKGVVKLFNSIYQFRKKIKDDKEIEGNLLYLIFNLIFLLIYFFLKSLLVKHSLIYYYLNFI